MNDDDLGNELGRWLAQRVRDQSPAERPSFDAVRHRSRQITNRRRAMAAVLVGALGVAVVVGIGSIDGEDTGPTETIDETELDGVDLRPSYWELDLSTPEAALATFLAHWRRGDFATVWSVLSRDTQVQSMNWQSSSGGEAHGLLVDDPRSNVFDLITFEIDDGTSFGSAAVFHDLVTAASERGLLRIDLFGGINDQILVIESSGSVAIEGRLGDGTAVTVSLSASPTGRWHIDQVVVPGGTEAAFPFSTPDSGPTAAVDTTAFIPFYDLLNLDTPQAAALTALTAIEQGDFFTLSMLLDLAATTETVQSLNNSDLSGMVPPAARDVAFATFGPGRHLPQETWRAAWEIGTFYIEPVGPFKAELLGEETKDDATITIVQIEGSDGKTVNVRLTQPRRDQWRIRQILAPGGDPDLFPLSGPTGVEAQPGSEICWDHIRYSCEDTHTDLALTTAAQTQIDAIRTAAEANEITPADAASLIASLTATGHLPVNEMCATMQGYRNDLTFTAEQIAEAPRIIDEACPGDPSLLAEG